MKLIDADRLKAYIRLSLKVTEPLAKEQPDIGELVNTFMNGMITQIDAMPTMDAVPVKHGKWTDIDSQMYTWKVRCDQCGHERSMMSTHGQYPEYCEACGARMDGKDDESN